MGRSDDWSTDVHARILSAIDLHAADALYHQKCNVNFRTGRQTPHCFLEKNDEKLSKKVKVGRPEDLPRLGAFEQTMKYFEENDEKLTIVDLVNKMGEFITNDQDPYSIRFMKTKMQQHFGEKLVIAELNGKADVVTL